jgi:hypothetical protein
MLAAGTAASLILVAGCGGSSKLVPGQSEAASACQDSTSSPVQAAALATHAAAVNPKFAVLAADEGALAASEANEEGELSDGTSAGDSSVGSLAGADAIGSGPDIKVVTDCTTLGLSVSK